MLVTLCYQSRRMELRHLRYFVAVAEELNFRKAAQRLSVSRPALSKQVKDLEGEMTVKLLERDTVSVSLTKAGEIFLVDARRILHHVQLAIERANEAQSGHEGKLRIGSVGIIATDFLPKTLKIFNQKYPRVEVEFVEMLPAEQLNALGAGKIDIGFAYGNDLENLPDLRSLCVIHSTFGVAMSRQHAFGSRHEITLEDLKLETLLSLGIDGRSSHLEAIYQIYAGEGKKFGKHRRIEGFDSMINHISADHGISLLPHVLDLTNQDIVIIPLISNETNLDFHMWAVWKLNSVSHHVNHFIQLLEERLLTSINIV